LKGPTTKIKKEQEKEKEKRTCTCTKSGKCRSRNRASQARAHTARVPAPRIHTGQVLGHRTLLLGAPRTALGLLDLGVIVLHRHPASQSSGQIRADVTGRHSAEVPTTL
jgi:hypothetical protein